MGIDVHAPDLAQRLNAVFAAGRLLALPTETVYGLAAPIDRPALIERVFELKGRPPNNPLIVHVGDLTQAISCVRSWPDAAAVLAERYWPGPLTLVLPRSNRISDRITAGQDTVALRMPQHPLALQLIQALGVPLVAPSANLFTRLSPTCAADVRAAFRSDDVEVVDGGRCRVGIESSIVALDPEARTATLLRPGMISRPDLADTLPDTWRFNDTEANAAAGEAALAPGRMRAHYRPERPLSVHLVADERERSRLRATLKTDPGVTVIELPATAAEAASGLYQSLRDADAQAGRQIVLLLPKTCLAKPEWEAVVNRLQKAASQWLEPGAGV